MPFRHSFHAAIDAAFIDAVIFARCSAKRAMRDRASATRRNADARRKRCASVLKRSAKPRASRQRARWRARGATRARARATRYFRCPPLMSACPIMTCDADAAAVTLMPPIITPRLRCYASALRCKEVAILRMR